MIHVVFISHDANRTGAPIVLLHLLRWLKKQQGLSFSILLLRGGELEVDFRAIAPTYIWQVPNPPAGAPPSSLGRRFWKRAFGLWYPPAAARRAHEQRIVGELVKSNTQLIYANTVVAAEVGVHLKTMLGCPAICHVHELAMAIEGYFGTARFGRLIPELNLLVAASEAVKNTLLVTYPVAVDKIVKVYEFIAQPEQSTASHLGSVARAIRSSLHIPMDAFLVVASGTFEWRKSPVLFIQLADYMRRNARVMPYFLWVGGNMDSLAWQELQYDLKKLELTEHVKFIGSRSNPLDYLQSADVFVLTSREDPYPLVCLEAAALAKPILCFEYSGGMPEFVENDCGQVIPFLQLDIMARAIEELLLDPAKRQRLGDNAQDKVRSRHSVEVAGWQILELLKRFLPES